MTQEVRLFARMSAFGLAIGAVYWFLTYETAGTVLLVGFGVAAGIAALAVFVGGRAAERRAARPATGDGTGAHESEPTQRPGWAPVGLAVGLGAVFLGGAFGPFPAIGGIVVTIVSAWSWLASAMNETDAARAAEAGVTAAEPQPDRGVSSPRS